MKPSLTPILLAIELGFLFATAAHARRRGAPTASTAPVHALLLWITLYAVLVSTLGYRGALTSERLLPWAPGFWLPVTTVLACAGPAFAVPRLREGLRQVVDSTPWHGWAGIHALRILAVGTLQKASVGEFPAWFALGVGLPDLLFGLSALWVARRAVRGELGHRAFLWWNVVGALVIVPAAPILIQLGLPGPAYVFTSQPDARAILAFPMAIAPLVGVPLFVLMNACVAWRLWERR
jgi:hypothetical protein